MAPSTGKQAGSRGKNKGDENSLERYVTNNDEVWKKSLERIIMEIEEMRKEMRGEMERMKEQMMEERRAREEERIKEREEWKQDRETLEKRIAELEEMNERRERRERKNNIVIKGVKWREMERLEQEVKEFIRESLKVDVEVKKVRKIRINDNKNIMVAEIDSWEQKREIMSKKKELEKGIIIKDDLTRKEREIQQKLRRIAKEEREKGDDKIRVGYMKISLISLKEK